MLKKQTSDYLLAFAPFFQFAVLMLQDLLISANIVDPASFRIFSIVFASLPMVPALFIVFSTRSRLFLITYAIIIYLVIFTLAFFPQNEKYLLEGVFYLLCINIPCFLCLMTINSLAILKRTMLLISYLITLIGFFYFIFLITGAISFERYDMAFGYYLLLPAVVYLNQGKIAYTMMFIAVCIMIFIIGSRGSLIAALIYSLLLVLIDRRSRFNILLISVVILLVLGGLYSFISDLLSLTSVSSRTLDLILEGDISSDSNRYVLYSSVWNGILESPVFGHGIYGDRLILEGGYSHNFFLEFFYNFGLYFGSLLLFIFSYLFGLYYYKSDNEGRKLLLMFLCYCFIPLMLSRSYLNDPGFGILTGAVLSMHKRLRITQYIASDQLV
jgi:hypothetical protein